MANRVRKKTKASSSKTLHHKTDAEIAKVRILSDFRKRLKSPNVKNLISMGNNGPKANNDTMTTKPAHKQSVLKERLFPPAIHHLSSSSESDANKGKAPRNVTKVHRRKTKSERNKTRMVVSSKSKSNVSKKPKSEDTTCAASAKEKSAFKKCVKSVDKPSKQKVDMTIDKSAITGNRLTVGLGFGLFNRKKKSGTALKDSNFIQSDLEIEVIPREKNTNATFNITNMYSKLKRSKDETSIPAAEDTFARTPQSVHSAISLNSPCSSNAYMDIDDHISLSSESFPSSPDLEAEAAFVATHDVIRAKLPDKDLYTQTIAALGQIQKMKNPNHDFQTPLSRKSASLGVSSEVVKRNLSDRVPPSQQLNRSLNSTSTTQLNVLAHKKGVEAMHMQYQQHRQDHPTDVRSMPVRDDPSHVKLHLARTRLTENLEREVWKHGQSQVQRQGPSSSQEVDISIRALTDPKTLLECNEKAAHQTKLQDVMFNLTGDEHAPMDFLDSVSNEQRRHADHTSYFHENPTHGTDMEIEMFASTTNPCHEAASFHQLYHHNRANRAPVSDRKVVTQLMPSGYSVTDHRFAASNFHQPWIGSTVHRHGSPRNPDILDSLECLEHESQSAGSHELSRERKSPRQSPLWKPQDGHKSLSPPKFYPQRMF